MSKIAIIGLGGFLGAPVLESLQSSTFADKVSFPILAVTRSEKESTDKIKYIKADLVNDIELLSKELAGVDTIVELVGADPTLFAATEKINAAVKPKLFVPSQFGVDVDEALEVLPGFLGLKLDHSNKLRAEGVKVVDIPTGLFGTAEGFAEQAAPIVGVDVEKKLVTYLGSPKNEFAYSILSDIGNVVAAVATGKPSSLPDKLRVQSGSVTQEKIVAQFSKSKLVELSVKEVSEKDAFAEAQKVWEQGFDGNKFLYYLNAVISQGKDKGLWFTKNDNEVVNPKESLWKWTTI